MDTYIADLIAAVSLISRTDHTAKTTTARYN